MKRPDQGHLHPSLEARRLTCLGRGIELGPPLWDASTLDKRHLNSYSKNLHMNAKLCRMPATTPSLVRRTEVMLF